MANAKFNKLCMEESDPMLKIIVRSNMEVCCICRLLGRSRIPKDDFGLAPTMENNCNFFRWRDREEIDPRSQFILPKLVNKIKELEDEVWRRQIQINEQQVLIDNLTVEKRFKRRKLKWCTFDWKGSFKY
ncbi:hypothetical protein KY290_025478 [Solanum tuberosum]|uniref:Zinc finger GRF-type domain-containing protein n=1 Tax=Solanum tuberosum TaxID=4113 RepID=A0ABQ7UTU0_SOLTU|nr:hypothetical protein KY290_025478 [Solanum tuberosum]